MTVISTAPAVKAAVAARLNADALIGGGGVHVSHGHPHPIVGLPELVHVGRTRPVNRVGDRYQGGQTPRQLGRDGREERYTITLTVSVVGNETDPYATLEARAYAIADLVDASLRAWRFTTPSAFDGVCRWAIVTGVEDDEAIEIGRGREARVAIELSVAAAIEPST